MALAACPNMTSKCGTRKIAATATPSTTTVTNVSSNDSCHYLITVDCKLPEIKIKTNTLGNKWNLDFIEFQADKKVEMQTSSNGDIQYPDFKVVPPFYPGYATASGTIPFLKLKKTEKDFPAVGKTTDFMMNFPIERLID